MEKPHAVVSALININNKVLLIKRGGNVYKHYWALPGGMIDTMEEPDDAITREVFEETGYKFIPVQIVCAYLIIYNPKNNKYAHTSIDIVYKGSVNKKSKVKDEKEIEDIDTFSINNLPKRIAFGHRRVINNYF